MTPSQSGHGRKHPPTHAEDVHTHSLDRTADASRVEVVHVSSSHSAQQQLARLGIRVGAILRVHRSAPLGGPVLVEVRGSQVAIGRALARKVTVKEL